jgi:hypothetical protein
LRPKSGLRLPNLRSLKPRLRVPKSVSGVTNAKMVAAGVDLGSGEDAKSGPPANAPICDIPAIEFVSRNRPFDLSGLKGPTWAVS